MSSTVLGTAIRRGFVMAFAIATAMILSLPASAQRYGRQDGFGLPGNGQKWAASWTTSLQAAYAAPTTPQAATISAYDPQPDLSFALPNASTDGASNQTMRMIIKPDLWGEVVRFGFSNAFGTKPVTFNAASVGLQSFQANLVKGSSVKLTFRGQDGVTIQPGQQLFSDPVQLPYVNDETKPLLRGRNLAVSFSFAGPSGPASYHLNAWTTSYISAPASGDQTQAENDVAFPYSTTSFFFLNEMDVLAPSDTIVICAFGDSITDGTFSTLNGNDRWSNVMSHQLHDRFGDHVSVVNAAIAGNGVAGTFVGPPATQRVGRDVIALSGVAVVVWLEGINDLGLGSTPDTVIAGYQQVVAALHAANIAVIGATVTPSDVPGGVVPANSPDALAGTPALAAAYGGPQTDQYRRQLNTFILTSGLYDATADFAAATTDPSTGTLYPQFVPNSEGSAGDYLHPNRAGYQVIGSVAADALVTLAQRRVFN